MEPIFFHFLRQQSTAAGGSSSSSNETYFSANLSFQIVKTSFLSTGNSIVLFRGFYASETITETWGKSIFKDEVYSCKGAPIFSIFQKFKGFLKHFQRKNLLLLVDK